MKRKKRNRTQEERYAATAARWNQKQAERNPLFAAAGILEQVADVRDADFYISSEASRIRRMEQLDKRMLRAARWYRNRILRRDPELLTLLEERWATRKWARDPAYEADHFHTAWRHLREGYTREEILHGRYISPRSVAV